MLGIWGPKVNPTTLKSFHQSTLKRLVWTTKNDTSTACVDEYILLSFWVFENEHLKTHKR